MTFSLRLIDGNVLESSFSYQEIERYLSSYKKNLLEGNLSNQNTPVPYGKFYKGKINNSYLITMHIFNDPNDIYRHCY